MTQPVPDRLQENIERVFKAQLDRLKFMIFWEYQVQNVMSGGTPVVVTCQLVSIDPSMPDATVVLRPGPDGSISKPATGSTVLVGFAGGDPSKPYIFATDPNSPPTHVWIAGGGSFVGRVGDNVRITQAELTAAGAQAGGNNVMITSDLICHIDTGSSIVESG